MTEQEIQEDAAIIDKASRQCGGELAQGGIRMLRVHGQQIAAMIRKLDRLETAAAAAKDASAPDEETA